MSMYYVTEKPSTFSIERSSYDRVTVELQPWALSVTSPGYPETRCGFYGQDKLEILIATRLLGEDDASANLANRRTVREARAIHTDVGQQRIRLLAQVDPAVHQVQLIGLRMAGQVPPLAQDPALYREPYILRDILNYRAAAIALGYLHSELRSSQADPSIEALVAAMANWRGLFSPDGTPYRCLNRTLMNLPADVPPELVCQLSKIRLERPVLNALELNALLLYVSTADGAPPEADLNRFRIIHHATAAEIADAVQRVANHTDRELYPRRQDDLRVTLRYLCDYPDPFHGSLPGLVERVIRWHRRAHERERLERQVRRLGGYDQPTALPPIPLPARPGVAFLDSVGAIVTEGERMHHCVATRAQDALHGRCYLFHVEHEGQHASVEVSAEGKISDAQGPHNTDNAAVRWAAAQLRAWGAKLCLEEINPSASPARRARRAKAADPNQLALPFL